MKWIVVVVVLFFLISCSSAPTEPVVAGADSSGEKTPAEAKTEKPPVPVSDAKGQVKTPLGTESSVTAQRLERLEKIKAKKGAILGAAAPPSEDEPEVEALKRRMGGDDSSLETQLFGREEIALPREVEGKVIAIYSWFSRFYIKSDEPIPGVVRVQMDPKDDMEEPKEGDAVILRDVRRVGEEWVTSKWSFKDEGEEKKQDRGRRRCK